MTRFVLCVVFNSYIHAEIFEDGLQYIEDELSAIELSTVKCLG